MLELKDSRAILSRFMVAGVACWVASSWDSVSGTGIQVGWAISMEGFVDS